MRIRRIAGQRTPAGWLAVALWLLALAGLLYLVGLTVWLGVTGLAFPYQLDYGEGVLLHFVKEWSQGHPIYKGLEGYPYITSNYAPVSMGLALALTPVLGLTYAAGRLWTLVALVAIAAILVAWVKQASTQWLPAAAAALLFLGSPYVYHWAPLFRVDLIGLALTLGGLYAVYVATRRLPRSTAGNPGLTDLALQGDQRMPSEAAGGRLAGGAQRAGAGRRAGSAVPVRGALLWLAVVLFVAALFTKQSYFFAPAAALAYVFLFVDRAWALRMAAAIAVLGGGLFLAINALTRGGFWESLVASNVNPFLWPEFGAQVTDFGRTFAVLGVLALWYLVDKFLLERAAPLRDRVSPVDLYLPAALLSIGLAGKAGAWENYFFEALAALALVAGLALARLGRGQLARSRVVRGLAVAAPVLVALQVALMWHTPRVAGRYLALTRTSNEAMAPILAATPDPILSEDMGLLVTNGKVLDYYSFQWSQLARAGRWDQSWEMDELRNRRASLVILERGTRTDVDHYQRFTREFMSELDRNYRHTQTVGKYEVYEPDPLQHERQVRFGDELALAGWSVDPARTIQPGERIELAVVWQARQAATQDYTAFAHLSDGDGVGWAGDDHAPLGGLYPTRQWAAGEMVRDTYTLEVPLEAPPGLYDLVVGWYDPATLERLAADEGDAVASGGQSSFRVAVLPVASEPGGPVAPGLSAGQALVLVDMRFGGAIRLGGYAWQGAADSIQLTLRWSAETYVQQDYTVFVHLVPPGSGGLPVSQGDGSPLDGRWPTSLWLPGVAVDDSHTIPLPSGLAPGCYTILVGLYDPGTGERLPLDDGRDAARLAEIDLP